MKRPFYCCHKGDHHVASNPATAAFLALGITAAQADDYTQASVYVPYGELNLARPSDAKVLADRLEDAAKSVCLKAKSGPRLPDPDAAIIGTAISMAMMGIENTLDQEVRAKLVVVLTSMANP